MPRKNCSGAQGVRSIYAHNAAASTLSGAMRPSRTAPPRFPRLAGVQGRRGVIPRRGMEGVAVAEQEIQGRGEWDAAAAQWHPTLGAHGPQW